MGCWERSRRTRWGGGDLRPRSMHGQTHPTSNVACCPRPPASRLPFLLSPSMSSSKVEAARALSEDEVVRGPLLPPRAHGPAHGGPQSSPPAAASSPAAISSSPSLPSYLCLALPPSAVVTVDTAEGLGLLHAHFSGPRVMGIDAECAEWITTWLAPLVPRLQLRVSRLRPCAPRLQPHVTRLQPTHLQVERRAEAWRVQAAVGAARQRSLRFPA